MAKNSKPQFSVFSSLLLILLPILSSVLHTVCHRPWVLNQRSKVYMTSNSLKLGLIIIIGKASLSERSQFRSFYVPTMVGAAKVAKERYETAFDSICSSQIVWIVQSPVYTPNFIPYLHVKL